MLTLCQLSTNPPASYPENHIYRLVLSNSETNSKAVATNLLAFFASNTRVSAKVGLQSAQTEVSQYVFKDHSLFLAGILMLSFGGCGNPGKSSDDAVATSSKAKLYSEQLLKSASVDVTAKTHGHPFRPGAG